MTHHAVCLLLTAVVSSVPFGLKEGVVTSLSDVAVEARLESATSWSGSVAPGAHWEYSGSRAAIQLYRGAIGTLIDADSTQHARSAAAKSFQRLGDLRPLSDGRNLERLGAQTLCRAVFVLNAGSTAINGLYEERGTYKNRTQYVLRQADTNSGSKRAIELFHAGTNWWNLQQVQDDGTAGAIFYGAYALGAYPPELGWASKIFKNDWRGDPNQPPLLIPVGQWFSEECAIALRGKKLRDDLLDGSSRNAMVAHQTRPTRYHVFTIGTIPDKAIYQATSCQKHGLDLHVLPGPWPNYVRGKIKNGICATQMLAARGSDIIVFADGYDAAWGCSGPQLEEMLVETGKPIVIGGEQSWWCPGCPAELKAQYERTFWRERQHKLKVQGEGDGVGGYYQFLNSGTLVARASAIGEFCQWVEHHDWTMVTGDGRPDDQSAWYEYATLNPDKVHVDFEQRMISNAHSTYELNLNVRHLKDSKHAVQCEVSQRSGDGRLINSCTGKPTCGVHAAGSCNGMPNCPELERRMSLLKGYTPVRL